MGLYNTFRKHENAVHSRIIRRRNFEHREQRDTILLRISTNQVHQWDLVSILLKKQPEIFFKKF